MSKVLSVRRTLVIGFGTTGKEVAETLAEHLTWQFGDFQKAAWVRLLVLETEQTPSFLGDRMLWAGMTAAEYAPYIRQPRTTGTEFGFYDWQDGPTLSAIHNPAAGAGNCRMLGRLCLFHPRTYSALQMRVTRDLDALKQLTPQKVADALGEPGLNVTIDRVVVAYVVGTLCGGTCSGGAADLGYLLDAWSPGGVDRQAIFTLPHPNLARAEAPRFKKNAFYALKELNHYQLAENPWQQRLPGFDAPMVRTGIPYDILRVVMPTGPTGEDVVQLNAMIAQYLAAAVGPAGFQIAANDVNAEGRMASTERIGFMRPLWSTMGIAALEYPGEHILRAATSRLLAATLRRWSGVKEYGSRGVWGYGGGALANTSFDALLQRLTQGADQMSLTVFQDMFKDLETGRPPQVEQVRQSLREVNGRLEAIDTPASTPTLPHSHTPTLLQIIQTNHAQILQSIGQDVERFMERSLFDLDGGPGAVAEALKQSLRDIESWAVEAQANLAECQQDARSLRAMLDEQIAEVERIQNARFMLGKGEKLAEGWQAVEPQMKAYLAAEMRAQAINHLQRRNLIGEMAEQYRRATAAILRRLEQMQAGFEQEAADLEARWKQMAASSPSVNGRVYFEAEPPAPRGTVTEEYFNLLRQRRWPDEPATGWDDAKKEEAAMREVLRALEPLRAELTREEGTSAFDPRPGVQSAHEMIPPALLDAAEARARAFFAPLRDQVHIADRAGEADLASVIQLSEPKLTISAAQVSDRLPGVRGVNPTIQDLAFTDMGEGGATLPPALERLTQRVINTMQLQRGGITDSDDPFRLLLIREKHGFTLGQMVGVIRANKNDLHALESAEHCRDFNFWHTRRDVNWVDPLIPPLQVETTEEAWLLAVLLGRPADGVLPWTPAAQGEIDPQGWYQIAAGEFCVYYVPGPDVSKKEERLPLRFSDAVSLLLSPDYATLRRTLNMRFNEYSTRSGVERTVRAIDQALQSLDAFGLSDLDHAAADRILRRAYRRNDRLTRAFFDYKTENLAEKTAQFAHLYHRQGDPIPESGSVYPADAYYCPACHHALGATVEQLLEAMFLCPRCNTSERYWP